MDDRGTFIRWCAHWEINDKGADTCVAWAMAGSVPELERYHARKLMRGRGGELMGGKV